MILTGYFLLGRWRGSAATVWLVLAFFFFYGYWDIRYVPLLLGSILFNFASGRLIEHSTSKRKVVLAAAITGNVALLGYFKYTAFFIDSVNMLTGTGFLVPRIVLPLGISFFTFTQTAYLVDAYRGIMVPEIKTLYNGTMN